MAVKKSYGVMVVDGGTHLCSVKWQYILFFVFFLMLRKISDFQYNNSNNNFTPAKSQSVCLRAILGKTGGRKYK